MKKRKYFLASMISTLLFLTLLSGLVIVEKNTRFIAFGDTSSFFSYDNENGHFSLSIHFMGKNYKLSV